MTLVTGRDGRFQFADLKPGAYCLSVDSQTPENAALLRSGDWISPALGADHIPLELAKGETKTLNFGWNRRTNNLSASGELCRDRATYIADITIPDNTGLAPEAEFTKTWRIRNEGNCAWDDTFSLVPKDQNRTLAETIVAIPEPVQPETELDLSVTLVAPKEVGTYRSNWSLQDEDGQTIGSFYLQILVQEAATEQP
jgi:hypothetical protein